MTCPICEKGNLLNRTNTNLVKYREQEATLISYYSACDYCGSEVATPKQTRVNKRAMLEFKEMVDNIN
jgi:YgiT-type zinc finger domain-containing protein